MKKSFPLALITLVSFAAVSASADEMTCEILKSESSTGAKSLDPKIQESATVTNASAGYLPNVVLENKRVRVQDRDLDVSIRVDGLEMEINAWDPSGPVGQSRITGLRSQAIRALGAEGLTLNLSLYNKDGVRESLVALNCKID